MKKPLALAITDSHYNKNNTEEVNNVLFQAIDRAVFIGCRYLIHCADVFTDRVGRSLVELLAFYEFLEKVEESGLFLIVLPGNHDKTDQSVDESYLTIFRKFKNVKVVEHFYIMPFIDKKRAFCFLPYFKEEVYSEKLIELEKSIPKNYNEVFLFTHIAVSGVKNNDGSLVDNDLKIGKFKRFKKVFIGHYHNRQEFGNICYFGSIMPQNFGEDNEKGWLIVNDDFSWELEKALFKKYIKINIDLSQKTGLLILEKMTKKWANNTNHVRFVLKGEESQLATINSKEYEALGIDIKKENIYLIRSIVESRNVEKLEMTQEIMFTEFDEWCEKNEIIGNDYELGKSLIEKRYVAN